MSKHDTVLQIGSELNQAVQRLEPFLEDGGLVPYHHATLERLVGVSAPQLEAMLRLGLVSVVMLGK